MQNFNPFSISGLLIAITYLPLFLLIIIRGKTKLARIFSAHIFAIFIWGIGSFLIGSNFPLETSFRVIKFAYSGVLFIPVFFLHTVFEFQRRKANLTLFLVYLLTFFFLVANLTGRMYFQPVMKFNSFFYYHGNILFILSFIFWVIVASSAHILLILFYQQGYPEQKKQIFFLNFAIIGFLGGLMNFFPAFGLDIYPYGNFLIPIHSATVSYAILKHQLLDIAVAIKKGIVYSTLIALISITYLGVVVLSEKILQDIVGYQSMLISVMCAFALGLFFFPLRNKIQHFVNKIFFQRTHAEIIQENEFLREKVVQSERLKSVATLASGVAHEIKNPLAAIYTFSEYLPKRLRDKKFLLQFSKIVGSETYRINELVQDLLDYAHPHVTTRKRTDMHKLIDETASFLNSSLLKQKITIEMDFRAERRFLHVDHHQFRQVFFNIFINAIDAMPNGGTLTITTKMKNRGSKRETFEISIEDSGCGIRRRDLTDIFDPFFTQKSGGTGLGLPITKNIVTKHHGKIRVHSKVKKGTRFTIELPVKPPPSHTSQSTPSPARDEIASPSFF